MSKTETALGGIGFLDYFYGCVTESILSNGGRNLLEVKEPSIELLTAASLHKPTLSGYSPVNLIGIYLAMTKGLLATNGKTDFGIVRGKITLQIPPLELPILRFGWRPSTTDQGHASNKADLLALASGKGSSHWIAVSVYPDQRLAVQLGSDDKVMNLQPADATSTTAHRLTAALFKQSG